jgi:hypothetical protein
MQSRMALGQRYPGTCIGTRLGLRRGYLILRCSTGAPIDVETLARLPGAETIGRPLGTRKFLDMLERKTKRVLKPAKRRPKPRIQES